MGDQPSKVEKSEGRNSEDITFTLNLHKGPQIPKEIEESKKLTQENIEGNSSCTKSNYEDIKAGFQFDALKSISDWLHFLFS